MKNIIIVPTVMHTGTHFVQAFFKGWCSGSPETLAYDIGNTAPEKNHYICEHVFSSNMPGMESVLAEYPALVPMRHPARIYESWARRKGLRETYARPDNLDEQFKNLIDGVDPYSPHYLVLDSPHRDAWLARANAGLGLNIETDWVASSTYGTHNAEITKEMVDRVPSFVMNFYEDRIKSVEAQFDGR